MTVEQLEAEHARSVERADDPNHALHAWERAAEWNHADALWAELCDRRASRVAYRRGDGWGDASGAGIPD